MAELTVISLGWGVQSFTVAAMAALGELPAVDFAIHADTTHERSSTYAFAAKYTPWLAERGVNVVTVSAIGQHNDPTTVATSRISIIPAYTLATGSVGSLRRQCTADWKIAPMRQHVAAELERRGLRKTPGTVEQWIGISLDEWHRAKDADVRYITHRFPLLDANMTRADCIAWLQRHRLDVPGKSSCTFCPYHNAKAWEQIKRENGMDWQEAVAVDAAIRDVRPPFPLFVHRSCKPLPEAVVIPEDTGYMQLDWLAVDNDLPCDSGACFL